MANRGSLVALWLLMTKLLVPGTRIAWKSLRLSMKLLLIRLPEHRTQVIIVQARLILSARVVLNGTEWRMQLYVADRQG